MSHINSDTGYRSRGMPHSSYNEFSTPEKLADFSDSDMKNNGDFSGGQAFIGNTESQSNGSMSADMGLVEFSNTSLARGTSVDFSDGSSLFESAGSTPIRHQLGAKNDPQRISPGEFTNNSPRHNVNARGKHTQNQGAAPEANLDDMLPPSKAKASKRAKKIKTDEQMKLEKQRRDELKAEKALIVSKYNKAQRAMFKKLKARRDANGVRSNRRGRPLELLPPEYDDLANIADEGFVEESLGIVDEAILPVSMERKVEILPSFLCSKWGFFVGGIKKIAGMSYEETVSFIQSFTGDNANLFEDYVRDHVAVEESKAETAERNLEKKMSKRKDHGSEGFPPNDHHQQNLGNNAAEVVPAQEQVGHFGTRDGHVAAMDLPFHQPYQSFPALSNAADLQLPGAFGGFNPAPQFENMALDKNTMSYHSFDGSSILKTPSPHIAQSEQSVPLPSSMDDETVAPTLALETETQNIHAVLTTPSPIWTSLNNGSYLKKACRDLGYDPQVYFDTLNRQVVAEYARIQAIGDGHGDFTDAVEKIRIELTAVFANREDYRCIPDWLHQRVALEIGSSGTASGP